MPSRTAAAALFASLLVVPSPLSGRLSATAAASAPPQAAPVLLTTPLLSPARAPLTLQGDQALAKLTPALDVAMSPSTLTAAGAAHSCAVVSQDGHVLFADHPSVPVMPASNMKLVTATALLDKLGPAYRFHTSWEASGPAVDGVVHGDLYLVGGGDPLLRQASFVRANPEASNVFTNVTSLVASLKAAGVRQVTGSVVGDAHRYSSQLLLPSWPARFYEEGDVGELSALEINDSLATAGGAVPVSAPPAEQAAGLLTSMLSQAGIKVAGSPGVGRAPAGASVLASVSSPPFSAVLGEVLRESDNTAMELMTRELGLHQSGMGSTPAGTAAVRADLKADGIPVKGLVNVDGSGLSPQDRVTCSLLTAVIEKAGPDGLLTRDLPVAGRSGTLADQLQGTPAAGRVRAKTGTLDGVKALSGWVEPVAGQGGGSPLLAQPVAFAIVLNNLPLIFPKASETAADLADRVAVDLARYPKAPALALYEP